jgi:hypothetical protein
MPFFIAIRNGQVPDVYEPSTPVSTVSAARAAPPVTPTTPAMTAMASRADRTPARRLVCRVDIMASPVIASPAW